MPANPPDPGRGPRPLRRRRSRRPGRAHAKSPMARSRNSSAVPCSRRSAGGRVEIRHPGDQRAGPGLAERKWIVGSQRDPGSSVEPEQQPERVGVVGERIHVEHAEVLAGRMGIIHRHQIGPGVEAVLDPADGAGERAAAVGKADPEPRQPLQHSAEDHRADRQRGFRRHADQPGQPVPRHPLGSQHVPRVHEHRGPQLLGGLEHRKQRRVIEVPVADVGADLDAGKAQLPTQRSSSPPPAPAPAAARCPSPMKRAGCAATVSARLSLSSRDEVEGVRRLGPVAEHDRHGGEHLHVHAVAVALLESARRRPAVVSNFPEKLSVHQHPGPAGARGGPATPIRRSRSGTRGPATTRAGCGYGDRS